MPLSPEQRTLRARIAAHTRWANEDPVAATERARANGPGSDDYWLAQQPADLPEAERIRRAKSAKSAHFARLALASSKARSTTDKAS